MLDVGAGIITFHVHPIPIRIRKLRHHRPHRPSGSGRNVRRRPAPASPPRSSTQGSPRHRPRPARRRRPSHPKIYGFPGTACISVNDEAIHDPGAPTLGEGDLVKLDVTAEEDGFVADAGVTVRVGRFPSPPTLQPDAPKPHFARPSRSRRPAIMSMKSAARSSAKPGDAVRRAQGILRSWRAPDDSRRRPCVPIVSTAGTQRS